MALAAATGNYSGRVKTALAQLQSLQLRSPKYSADVIAMHQAALDSTMALLHALAEIDAAVSRSDLMSAVARGALNRNRGGALTSRQQHVLGELVGEMLLAEMGD